MKRNITLKTKINKIINEKKKQTYTIIIINNKKQTKNKTELLLVTLQN